MIYRRGVTLLSPLVRKAVRFLLSLLFQKWRQHRSIYLLSLENILGTRERIPLILSLRRVVKENKGRMTVAGNLWRFGQVEPTFLKYVGGHNARLLEIGPGLLNPFAVPFLFLLYGYCSQYFGVDISEFRWDFALYGLNVLIDDVIREPQKYRFSSRVHAVKSVENIIDFKALRDEDTSEVFVDHVVKLFVYDGIHIDQILPGTRDIDFCWSQDVFERLRQPRTLIERIPHVMKPDGIMYTDTDFKDHFFRDKGKDEWSFLERDTWTGSLNRLRAHEMIDGIIRDYFEVVKRVDTFKEIPPGRKERFSRHF